MRSAIFATLLVLSIAGFGYAQEAWFESAEASAVDYIYEVPVEITDVIDPEAGDITADTQNPAHEKEPVYEVIHYSDLPHIPEKDLKGIGIIKQGDELGF